MRRAQQQPTASQSHYEPPGDAAQGSVPLLWGTHATPASSRVTGLAGASPRWIISARFGCAKTLATRNTMSAFLGLTRSVRSARLRKPRKSLVYTSRFSCTKGALRADGHQGFSSASGLPQVSRMVAEGPGVTRGGRTSGQR